MANYTNCGTVVPKENTVQYMSLALETPTVSGVLLKTGASRGNETVKAHTQTENTVVWAWTSKFRLFNR